MINELKNLELIQITLPAIAVLLSFISIYCNANIILSLYNEHAGTLQKVIFSFICGPIASVLPIYTAYFLGGSMKMSPFMYLVFRNINPIFALLYAYLGIKILGLSSVRSFRIMSISFLVQMAETNLILFIGSTIFTQLDSLHYDIDKDFKQQFVVLILILTIYFISIKLIKRWKSIIKISDSLFTNIKKEIVIYFLRSSIVFALAVSIPLFMQEKSLAYFLIASIICLILIVRILEDYRKALTIEMENMAAHINIYKETVEDFRGIKHDFYNILQTYGGYLEIGNLEGLRHYHSTLKQITTEAGDALNLSAYMDKNPSLISLIYNKVATAKQFGVHIDVTISTDLSNLNLFIDPMDLCRVLACLFDNAIEASCESEQKHIQFTIKSKLPSSVLIILSNSTSVSVDTAEVIKNGFTSKQNHSGIGLTTVQNILRKYGNCSFHMNYYNKEITIYIELIDNSHVGS